MPADASIVSPLNVPPEAFQESPALPDRRRLPRLINWSLVVVLPFFYFAFLDFFRGAGGLLLLTSPLISIWAHLMAMRRLERICSLAFREQFFLTGWPAEEFVERELYRAQVAGAGPYIGVGVLWLLVLVIVGGHMWALFALWIMVTALLQIIQVWAFGMQVYIFCRPEASRIGPGGFFALSALIYLFGPYLILLSLWLVAAPIITIPLVPWIVYGLWLTANHWRTRAVEQYVRFE